MKLSDLGEFGLIERLAALAPQWTGPAAERLVVGIGDDAAVWREDDAAVIATTDTLVAVVHFLPECTPWRDLGWKALAVNVSDVAAMGGTPEFALVTLGLPPETAVDEIDELYAGLGQASEAFAVAIAGGDIVRSPVFFITVTLTGRAELDSSGRPQVLRRSAAQAGDLIAVTGALGGSAGGLRILREGGTEGEVARALIERHLRPEPRVRAGRAALAAGVRCAIDVSDGLMQDLGHVCRASGLGAVVWRDKVPTDPALAQFFDADETLRLAVSGGEDYELLFTGSREQIDAVARDADVPVTVIGEMVIAAEQEAKLLDEAGREVELPSSGWDHLSGSE